MLLIAGLIVGAIMLVIGCHFGYILCDDHPAAFLMGVALARWTYLGFKDLQADLDERVDMPTPITYKLTQLEAMAIIRDTLTYTSLGDKWWHIRDINLDEGRVLASVSTERQYSRFADLRWGQQQGRASTQVVLIGEVVPQGSGFVKVQFRFVVTAEMGRADGTQIVKSITATLNDALELRAPKPTGKTQEVAA